MLEVVVLDSRVEVRVPPGIGTGGLLTEISKAPPHPGKHFLIDASAIAISDGVAHALLGEHMAERFGRQPNRKVALIVSEAIVTYNTERAAQRHGLNVRTFTDRADALDWLAQR